MTHIQSQQSGFPSGKLQAIPNRRYIGMFYYCAYWRQWDQILDVQGEVWVVRKVANDKGQPTLNTPIRKHLTTLWANSFADHPFNVYE